MNWTADNLNADNDSITFYKCDRYWSGKNYKRYKFVDIYEGIPETFVIGLTTFLLLMLLFSCVRRSIWNHGRLALVHRLEHRDRDGLEPEYNIWASLYFGGNTRVNKQAEERDSVDYRVDKEDQGLFSWIVSFLKITDEEMRKKCGQDAVQFLMFQKYLIVFTSIVAFICLTLILPLNVTQGHLEGSKFKFGSTTLNNISPNSRILWIHCSVGICFLCLGIVFMHHFINNVRKNSDEVVSKTVMISHIPRNKCFRHYIAQHFEEAYPECDIDEIQFAYDVHRLTKLSKNRDIAEAGLKYSKLMEIETGKRPRIMPYCCSTLCCCKCCTVIFGAKEVDAIEFYSELFDTYDELCEAEKVTAFHNVLGFAFVTFEKEYMAARVSNDFRYICKFGHQPRKSTLSRELDVPNWTVQISPAADNIFWENLSVKQSVWWLKTVLANIVVLFLIFFLTTPTVVFNELSEIQIFSKTKGPPSSSTFVRIIEKLVPTLLLLIVSSWLPLIVKYADSIFVGYYTKTTLNYSIMSKVYIFMLIMIVIMPALGFSSLLQFVRHGGVRWSCFFDSSNCAFYVNYMISSATISNSVHWLRVMPLLKYLICLGCVRSKFERIVVEKRQISEFEYGLWYARILCHFSITIVYSIPNPLITIPGLLYHVMKYHVDRHNLYYAFRPSKIDDKIHECAVYFVIVGLTLLMLHLLCFTLRSGTTPGIKIYMIVAIILALVVFSFVMYMNRPRLAKPVIPGPYESISESKDYDPRASARMSFLPGLLAESLPADAKSFRRSKMEYGTVDRQTRVSDLGGQSSAPRTSTIPVRPSQMDESTH